MSGTDRRQLQKSETRWEIETLPIFPICFRPSQDVEDVYDFEFSLAGKIWEGRETVESPDRLGFSRHMKTSLHRLKHWC